MAGAVIISDMDWPIKLSAGHPARFQPDNHCENAPREHHLLLPASPLPIFIVFQEFIGAWEFIFHMFFIFHVGAPPAVSLVYGGGK